MLFALGKTTNKKQAKIIRAGWNSPHPATTQHNPTAFLKTCRRLNLAQAAANKENK
jgi:hypothetical protein